MIGSAGESANAEDVNSARLARPALSRSSACSVWIGAAYFLYCLSIQASSGAWKANFTAYPDEPSHFIGAVMLRDWLLSGAWLTPGEFARNYYNHYPFFALGYWPPLYHFVTATVFLVIGLGRMQALLVPAACAAATGWMIFRFLKEPAGLVVAACTGAIYLSLPAVQTYLCEVMVDHMTACFCIAVSLVVMRYLKQPTEGNGVLVAVLCACAILTKYSAGYIAALPLAAILLFRKGSLLLKRSFLLQPVTIALITGPWIFWTWHLMFYGLPAGRRELTVTRVASFLGIVVRMFRPPLLAVVVLGLCALLLLRRGWREELGVLLLVCFGHLVFLILSPVDAEPRYLLVPVASLLLLSVCGWVELLRFVPAGRGSAMGVPAAILVLTAAFAVFYFGRYQRQPEYPIRQLVSTVLANKAWAGHTVVVPSDLEGPFIAEFVEQDRSRPNTSLVRPRKTLSQSNWAGGHYSLRLQTPDQMLEYFRQHPVQLVIWHERPEARLLVHDRILAEMLRKNPQLWCVAGTLETTAGGKPAWTLYEYTSLPANTCATTLGGQGD